MAITHQHICFIWLLPAYDYISTSNDGKIEENVYHEKIISFDETQMMHKPDPLLIKQTQNYEPSQKVDLNNFLMRPYPVENFVWHATDIIGTLMSTVQLPRAVWDLIFRKVDRTRFMAPDFEVTVQVNGSRMQYGRLMIAVDPMAIGRGTSYFEFMNASSAPKWYQVNAGLQQSVTFKVPFFHVNNKISVTASDAIYQVMSRLRIYVQAPLRAVDGVARDVECTVWVRLLDPKLSNYTVVGAAQSLEQQAKGVNSFKPSTILNAGAKALNFLSDTAQTLGYSTPINPADTTAMQIRQPLFMKSDENPNSVNLGPSQNCRVGKSSMEFNEMTIVQHCKQFTLIQQIDISANNGLGTRLVDQPLTPIHMYTRVDGYVVDNNLRYVSPAYYYSRLFNYWRGSFRVCISFICSAFHSCRLRAVWLPQTNGVAATTFKDQSYANSLIMDINESTDFRFSIPFDCMTNWLQNFNNDPTLNTTNGRLEIYILNELTSGSPNTPNPIQMQIFMSMDDDFQLASPRIQAANYYGNPDFTVITNLSNNDEKTDDEINKNGEIEFEQINRKIGAFKIEAQSLEATVKSCTFQSSSNECLMDSDYPSITGTPTILHRVGYTQSYEFTSPKQIASLLSPIRVDVTGTTENYHGTAFYPFGSFSNIYTDQAWYNYFTQMRAIFVCGRGSVRLVCTIDKTNIQGYSYPHYAQKAIGANTYISSTFVNPTNFGNLSNNTAGYQFTLDTSLMPLDTTLPYYAVPDWKLLINDITGEGISSPRINGVISEFSTQGTAGLHIDSFVAAGNDFEFCYPSTIPRLRKAG